MSNSPQSTNCYVCGAPMFVGETYCPKCRSPQLTPGGKASGIGIKIVGLIVALALAGVVMKLFGVFPV